MRQKLVDTIIELSDDELLRADLISMAKEDTEALVDRLISIAEWYKNNYNEKD